MNEDLNTPHFTIHEASDDVWLAKHALDNNAQDGYWADVPETRRPDFLLHCQQAFKRDPLSACKRDPCL
jgi:hypothetical protein